MTRDEFLRLAEDAGLPVLFRGYTLSHADAAEMYRRMRNDHALYLEKMGQLYDQLARKPKAANGAAEPPWKGATKQ
jgi:hypothetical protein